MAEAPLLSVRGLRVSFPAHGRDIYPVRGIDFDAFAGKTLGLVGESGSGKTLTALSLIGLVPAPGKITGSVRWGGRELVGLPETQYEDVRGGSIAMVFQDPGAALNPVLTIERQLVETIVRHKTADPKSARAIALDSLKQVDVPAPESRLKSYPHQLSGGMKQRVLIAMALACDSKLLILDEPTTALDVTVQAQILDLIERIQHFNGLSIILISHDLSVIAEVSDDIGVMYAGRIVEQASTKLILGRPRHPYTFALLNSMPTPSARGARLNTIKGFAPDPAQLPGGCPFHPRCPRVMEKCSQEDPPLSGLMEQVYACWNPVPTP